MHAQEGEVQKDSQVPGLGDGVDSTTVGLHRQYGRHIRFGRREDLFGFEKTDFEVGMEHPCENSQWANGFKDLGDRRVWG